MRNNEALRSNQLKWILDPLQDKSLGDFKSFKAESRIELGLVNEDTVAKIAKTLHCSSEDIATTKECAEFKPRIKDRVIMLKDDTTKSLYFGYAFIVNSSGLGGDNFRNVIYERAQDAWAEISDEVARNPTYQQFHIGYTSGGSIAYLIGCRVLASAALPFSNLESNELNYVKVVTVDELPIYTSDTLYDPVGKVNHAILTTTSNQSSSPDYSHFGTIIDLPKYAVRKHAGLSIERLALFMSHRNALSRLQGMSERARKRFNYTVRNQLAIVDAISADLVQVFSKRSFALYGQRQNEFANILEDYLGRFLPHRRESEIWCKAKNPAPKPFDPNSFMIQCSIKPEETAEKLYALASFEASLIDVLEREEKCNEIKIPHLHTSVWSKCIRDIALQSDELSLISPYGDGDSGNCHFFADMKTIPWNKNSQGFIVKPNSSDESLALLYNHEPLLFLSLFAEHVTFPKSCVSVIKPVRLKDNELVDASKLLGIIFKYFQHMSREFVLNGTRDSHNQLPELFRSHHTKKFVTKQFVLSGHQFVADDKVAQEILRCTSSKHAKIIDCTLTGNHWIPNACPEFCIHGKPENLHVCTQIMYCPTISAYIGYTPKRFSSVLRTSIVSLTTPELESSNLAQYALYSFSTNSYLDLYEMTVGVFFTKLPNVEMVRKNRSMKRTIRGQKLDEDELWNNNL
jgi:hypothetical protein